MVFSLSDRFDWNERLVIKKWVSFFHTKKTFFSGRVTPYHTKLQNTQKLAKNTLSHTKFSQKKLPQSHTKKTFFHTSHSISHKPV